MIVPCAIIIGDEQQPLPIRSAVRIIEQSQASKMDAAAAREINVRLADVFRKPLAFDVIANPVERQTQALLIVRLDPGNYNEPVRGNGASFAFLSITSPTF